MGRARDAASGSPSPVVISTPVPFRKGWPPGGALRDGPQGPESGAESGAMTGRARRGTGAAETSGSVRAAGFRLRDGSAASCAMARLPRRAPRDMPVVAGVSLWAYRDGRIVMGVS